MNHDVFGRTRVTYRASPSRHIAKHENVRALLTYLHTDGVEDPGYELLRKHCPPCLAPPMHARLHLRDTHRKEGRFSISALSVLLNPAGSKSKIPRRLCFRTCAVLGAVPWFTMIFRFLSLCYVRLSCSVRSHEEVRAEWEYACG